MTNVQPLSATQAQPGVPLGPAIRESFNFIRVAWRRAWGAMLLLVWVTAISAAIQGLRPEWTAAPTLGLLIVAIVSTMATGALYRIGLESDHAGDPVYAASATGLQWTGLEWRILGANILIGLMLIVLFIVLVILWGVALGVSSMGNPEALQAVNSAGSSEEKLRALGALMAGPAGVATLLVLLPGLLAIFYLGVRLSLFTLNAVDTRSFDFGKAWALTKGAVVTIMVTAVVIFLAEVAAGAICGAVAGFFSAFLAPGRGAMWGGVAGQAIGAAISGPLFAGLQLYVLHQRHGDRGIAATFA